MGMRERGLGRGLSALFGDDSQTNENNGVLKIKLSKIEPNRDQPRKQFSQEALNELADSIRQHGIITPLALRKLKNGQYQIIAGERRWRAARIAGLTEVPSVVLDVDDKGVMELALVENLQREDLNAIEEAEGYKILMEEYGLTQDEVATRVGKSRSAVANSLRLLTLPDSVRKMIHDGVLTGGHARAVLSADGEKNQESIAKKIIEEGLNVRQAEALVKKPGSAAARSSGKSLEKPVGDSEYEVYIADTERKLSEILARKVKIVSGNQKGRIELEYYGDEDMDVLVQRLQSLASSKNVSRAVKKPTL